MKKIPMQASKWLDVPALLEVSELQALQRELPAFQVFFNGVVVEPNGAQISWERFLEVYRGYIQALKEGNFPDEIGCRPFFSSVWTVDAPSIFISETPTGKIIPRPWKPVVQLQLHKFSISEADGKVRSMVFGQDTIFWGIQWSFPQFYMDPDTRDVVTLSKNDVNGNFSLFKQLQRWMRYHTEPSTFYIQGKGVTTPLRIGPECKEWIKKHPQLEKFL